MRMPLQSFIVLHHNPSSFQNPSHTNPSLHGAKLDAGVVGAVRTRSHRLRRRIVVSKNESPLAEQAYLHHHSRNFSLLSHFSVRSLRSFVDGRFRVKTRCSELIKRSCLRLHHFGHTLGEPFRAQRELFKPFTNQGFDAVNGCNFSRAL